MVGVGAKCSTTTGPEVASYYIVLSLHLFGAAIWAGGHLVLALTILFLEAMMFLFEAGL